ncbi:MAG: ogr/Delta-like zinc finger family protein [Desulfobacteraceae bacterium]|nr:ogr/Delta-like zinc finger family protein [Desulfobacteraceae bacterium]
MEIITDIAILCQFLKTGLSSDRCQSPARINSTSEESKQYKKLYCCCKNHRCGHTFVMELSFSHTLSPSAIDFPKEFIDKISRMTQMQQQRLFADF